MSVSSPDPLGPDGPYLDPLGAAAPAAHGEPMLAEVGSPEHRAALESIYGPNHDSWEAIQKRADVLGVSPEDYVFGVREAHLAELEANMPPEPAPDGYPHLDWLTEQPARPWSDEDWERDRLRAERAAAPVELGGGGILALADFDRATWEAHVAQGVDPVATIARAECAERQQRAEIHRAQALAAARENRQRQQGAERDRAEGEQADREAWEREVRRHGESTARARRMLAGQRVPPRLMR
jgi:hypothetical protein